MPIPWVQIARMVPSILSLSNEILNRSRKVEKEPSGSLEARLRELEDAQGRQAELLHQMARQNESLTHLLASTRRALQSAVLMAVAALILAGISLVLFFAR